MKAILMTATGNSNVLIEQEIAEPNLTQPTEIKIRLHAAGINPVDTKIRRGGLFYPNAPLPAVLGCDGAGEIVEIGSAVSQFKVGNKVWFCHGGLGREQGNYAEYTVIDQRWISLMPRTLDFQTAAAAPLVLITAWGALFERGDLQAGQTVLIHAGAGGVGHVAIQLAKIAGARVITTVSSIEKAAFAKLLGADEVIFYNQTDVAAEVNRVTANHGANLVLDTVGADVFKASIPCTAHFGRIVTLLDASNLDLSEARMRNLLIGFELMLTPMLRDLHAARKQHVTLLKQCATYIDAGKLKIHVSQVLPLAEAKTAHDLIETGHTMGKLVLSI
ncbi:MAG: zinc-dependent alcohol dehydrogenase family protein [Methylococcales bacterium]|nr:zinc-dependent alcohol dehydrogenase family protein [Methylococcales bacterium]MDD5755011.1 zinc-dependent alcohol dehydrogenase family protein [Methylococcales bacterium]